jgi:uncharacterized protein (DUF2141 family)
MHRRSSLILAMLISPAAWSQARLTVEVELNKPQAGGTVHIAVCPSAEAYDKEKGCRLARGKASGAMVRIELPDLPEGRYAIKAFHDVNDNGEFDFNLFGIPKEPYGFSNNVMGTMGAPKFEQAAFDVK